MMSHLHGQTMDNAGNQVGSLAILLCGDFFWPSVGGSELYLEDIALRLTEQGHRVEIACRWHPERILGTYKGLRIHQFHCSGNLLLGISGDLTSYRKLIFEGGYDSIFILTHPDNWNFVALLNPPITRPRIVAMPSINSVNVEEWNRRGLGIEICKILRAPDLLIRASESGCDAKFFARWGLESVFIPHAVEPMPDDSNFRERFGLTDSKPLLVMVANFWPVKNHDLLIKTLRDVPGDWQLALIGHRVPYFHEKRYYNRVKRLASQDQRVRMFCGLSRKLSLSAIRDADLILLPSKGESAGPLVILEAMSLGTPWLATPSCNAVHDQAGGLVQSLSMFPQTLTELLLRKDLLAKLGNLGKEDWLSRFTWAKVLPAYLDALLGNDLQNHSLLMPTATRNENALIQKAISLKTTCLDSKPAISVIIPTYNRCEILLKCLTTLDRQTILHSDFEVIVCDDGSTDDTADAVAQFPSKFPLRYFRQDNRGPASARNMGIEQAKADLLLFLNDDALLEPDALRIHLEEHARQLDTSIAVLGRFSLHPDFNNISKPVAFAIEHSDLVFDYSRMVQGKAYGYRHFYTCNISLYKAFLRQVGCFDESFTTAGAEDIELGYRLERTGLSIVYRNDCVAWHAHRLEATDLAKMFTVRGKGGVSLYIKHPRIPHHYRDLSLRQVRDFQARHCQLEPLLMELCAVVRRFDVLSFSPPEKDVVLSESESGIRFRYLFQSRDDEIRAIIERLIDDMGTRLEWSTSSKSNLPLNEAAETVYPVLAFIKWYYDTLGITESLFVEHLIEIQNHMKLSKFLTYIRNVVLSILYGDNYLYRKT